ncbi:MAG: hypothetical protein ABSA49_11760 [Rhizomicrobium sp.]|jgi:hypothetical protein
MDWIEKLFGLGQSIDGGDGKLEMLIVAALAIAAATFIGISPRLRQRPLPTDSKSRLQ